MTILFFIYEKPEFSIKADIQETDKHIEQGFTDVYDLILYLCMVYILFLFKIFNFRI